MLVIFIPSSCSCFFVSNEAFAKMDELRTSLNNDLTSKLMSQASDAFQYHQRGQDLQYNLAVNGNNSLMHAFGMANSPGIFGCTIFLCRRCSWVHILMFV
jgi:hypothetical protein